MKYVLSLTFLLFCSFITSTSYATTHNGQNVVRCDRCNLATMKTQAIRQAPEGGKVHVFDLVNNTVKAFYIEREQDLLIIQNDTVSPNIKTGITHLKTSVDQIADIISRDIDIQHLEPYLGVNKARIQSAYDLSRVQRYQSDIGNAISEYIMDTIAGNVSTAIAALGLQVVNGVMPVHVSFHVRFSDGTTSTFIFQALEYNLSNDETALVLIYKKDSGKDGEISIPDLGKFLGFSGTINSVDELNRLVEYMRQSGVTISDLRNPGRGQPVVVICDDLRNCTQMPH